MTRIIHYPAIFFKDHKDEIGITFPDLPGCTASGKTKEEAYMIAADTLTSHIEKMLKNKETLPKPSLWKDIEEKYSNIYSFVASGIFPVVIK